MIATNRIPKFRKYDRPAASNWRLVPVILLAAFDIFIVGYLIHGLWPGLWREIVLGIVCAFGVGFPCWLLWRHRDTKGPLR